MAGGIWCVIPIKDMANAKTRLAPALSPEERRAAFALMAEDVLAAAAAAEGLAGVLVLTNDPEARTLASRYGAEVASEPENVGQSEAVARAADIIMARGAEGVLTLPADAPLTTPAEIESILKRHPAFRPALTIVPDHARRGSNCLVMTPGDVIPLHFGHQSFEPHLAEAERAGLVANILTDLAGIALDVDTGDDLAEAVRRGGSGRALDYVRRSGIAARLGVPSS